jgi:hypothetical protein
VSAFYDRHKQINVIIPHKIPFQLVVRKRPLMSWEISQGDYDAIQIQNAKRITDIRKAPLLSRKRNVINSFENPSVILHDGKMARNGRRLTMTHKTFLFDQVFDEGTDNEFLCDHVVGECYIFTICDFYTQYLQHNMHIYLRVVFILNKISII